MGLLEQASVVNEKKTTRCSQRLSVSPTNRTILTFVFQCFLFGAAYLSLGLNPAQVKPPGNVVEVPDLPQVRFRFTLSSNLSPVTILLNSVTH